MEEKKESIWKRILVKLTSFKNIMAVWSMFMITYIIFSKQPDFVDICWGFLAICGGDVIANVIQKKINK